MSRTVAVGGLFVAVVVGLVTVGIVMGPPRDPGHSATNPGPGPLAAKPVLADPPDAGGAGSAVASPATLSISDVLVLPNCHLNVIDKQEVPTERDGKLIYVATEPTAEELASIPQGASNAELLKRGFVRVFETFIYEEMKPGDMSTDDVVKIGGSERRFKRVRSIDGVESSKMELIRQERILRRLEVGMEVKEGQLLALVDPDLALTEFAAKKTKVKASRAEWEAAVKTRDEALERFTTLRKLREKSPQVVSLEELRGAQLTYDRYFFEEIAKRELIGQSEKELDQTLAVLLKHEIRAVVPGTIQLINHHRGDAVKNQETLMQILNHDRLRVEGRVELQHLATLRRPASFVLEPQSPQSPRRIFSGHTGEVRSVAVSANRKVVSGSDDGTARVWDRQTGKHFSLRHGKPVLAVACTPKPFVDANGDKANLCLTGCADGYARLWNLDKLDVAPVVLSGKHASAINGVAFSPSGSWCATASEDRSVILWDTKTGQMVQQYRDLHRGGVTSVQFLSREELQTAGRDNSLAVLTLDTDGSEKDRQRFDNRTGDVTFVGGHPGTNPGTKLALFDQGRELRIREMPSGHLVDVIQNNGDAMNFGAFAIFSPDEDAAGKPTMVLTGCAGESRVQLWRMPTGQARGYELRQMIWPGSPTTCGAFAPLDDRDGPEDRFAVTGTRDHQVVLWALPSQEEVKDQKKATLQQVGPIVDSSRELPIWAVIDNSDRRLKPGQTATLVIYPSK